MATLSASSRCGGRSLNEILLFGALVVAVEMEDKAHSVEFPAKQFKI